LRRWLPLLLVTAAASLGCDKSSSDGATTPTGPPMRQTFTGTIRVGGSSSNTTFVVSTAGEVDITVVSVGPPANITMGLAIGLPTGADSSCIAPATAGSNVQASATPIVGMLDPGTYCVKLYDVGFLTAPVNYTITVAHS
jgi:hypothetical protein